METRIPGITTFLTQLEQHGMPGEVIVYTAKGNIIVNEKDWNGLVDEIQKVVNNHPSIKQAYFTPEQIAEYDKRFPGTSHNRRLLGLPIKEIRRSSAQ